MSAYRRPQLLTKTVEQVQLDQLIWGHPDEPSRLQAMIARVRARNCREARSPFGRLCRRRVVHAPEVLSTGQTDYVVGDRTYRVINEQAYVMQHPAHIRINFTLDQES